MNDVTMRATPALLDDLKALITKSGEIDPDAFAKLALVQRMLNNSLTVANRDPGNHLLGAYVDWGLGGHGPITTELHIPPGGQQRIENFQFMTIWFQRIQIDPPVQLTNNTNFMCYYEVTKLLNNGVTQQMQIVNPAAGSSELYGLDVGQRLMVQPISMQRYVLEHDPALRSLTPAKLKAH
jgi:hypothetical protein